MIYQPLLALKIRVQVFTKQTIHISLPSPLCKKMKIKKNIVWNENAKNCCRRDPAKKKKKKRKMLDMVTVVQLGYLLVRLSCLFFFHCPDMYTYSSTNAYWMTPTQIDR
jgi:hypothetical protein